VAIDELVVPCPDFTIIHPKTVSNLGIVAQERGNLTRARDLYERALTLRQELGDRKGVAIALNGLGI